LSDVRLGGEKKLDGVPIITHSTQHSIITFPDRFVLFLVIKMEEISDYSCWADVFIEERTPKHVQLMI
jgi:hypothetical protein